MTPRATPRVKENPVDIPTYTVADAAHHLRMPAATIRSWLIGRPYPTARGERRFEPLVFMADSERHLLSFRDLVELHVLGVVRRSHRVKVREIRSAIDYLRKTFKDSHPLSARQMLTDGKDLFIERFEKLINISQKGQMEMKELLDIYLRRIKHDRAGVPIRLYPFTRDRIEDAPLKVAIDPRIRFGDPCLAGTRIPTSIIMERYRAGDSFQELAKDYGRPVDEIEEAIRYEEKAA
jgi:uncharacterized protein (DUF433 family)